MPITATGYIVNISGDGWKFHNTGGVGNKGKAESHAERQVFNKFSNKAGPYLIVQDAFPCFDKCHQFFLTESHEYNVIIKVTANNSFDGQSYVKQGLITALTAYPYYIYYRNGVATFRTSVPNMPQGFPTHPDPQNV